jgi:DNA-binding transcriptional ArsR family regulator
VSDVKPFKCSPKARLILRRLLTQARPLESVSTRELGDACDSASGAVAAITLPLREAGLVIREFGEQRIGTTYRLNPDTIEQARAAMRGPAMVDELSANWVPPARDASVWAWAQRGAA